MRLLLLLALFFQGEAFALDMVRSSIQVFSHSQTPDYDSPWKNPAIKTNNFMGVYIGESRFLVSAYTVAYAKVIEGSRFGDSRKYPLTVEKVDYVANLAVLSADEGSPLLKDMSALEVGKQMRAGDQAYLWAASGERVIELPLRLREVDVRRGGTSPYMMTHYNFESRQSVGLGWAEPIVLDDKLVALAVGQSNGIVYSLPAKIINHFLDDLKQEKYRGFVRLGVTWRNLRSPHLRAYLKAGDEENGVLVTEVAENSPFHGQLKPGDILVGFQNITISDSGYYQHPLWGRIHFIDRISDLYAGEEISLRILRSGKMMEIKAVAQAYNPESDPIPEMRVGKEPHLIFGGLLFQELSKGYLASWGDDWQQTAPDHLVFLWTFQNKFRQDQERRFITLNRVLADGHNKGYEKLGNLILKSVNDKPVNSLREMKAALLAPIKQGDEAFVEFKFMNYGGSVVLTYKNLAKAHARIADKYAIMTKDSFFDPAGD